MKRSGLPHRIVLSALVLLPLLVACGGGGSGDGGGNGNGDIEANFDADPSAGNPGDVAMDEGASSGADFDVDIVVHGPLTNFFGLSFDVNVPADIDLIPGSGGAGSILLQDLGGGSAEFTGTPSAGGPGDVSMTAGTSAGVDFDVVVSVQGSIANLFGVAFRIQVPPDIRLDTINAIDETGSILLLESPDATIFDATQENSGEPVVVTATRVQPLVGFDNGVDVGAGLATLFTLSFTAEAETAGNFTVTNTELRTCNDGTQTCAPVGATFTGGSLNASAPATTTFTATQSQAGQTVQVTATRVQPSVGFDDGIDVPAGTSHVMTLRFRALDATSGNLTIANGALETCVAGTPTCAPLAGVAFTGGSVVAQ
jgi:hypothetical protein